MLTHISDDAFETVISGMQDVVEHGTARIVQIPGINICAKTGTAENYRVIDGRRTQLGDNSMFVCFAPRENPKIAIMCVVENSGRFGGTYAAPIVGLMIEKYLKDSITDPARIARIEQLSNLNLMPPRIFIEIKRQDSMRHAKDSAYLIAKGYIKILKDTIGLDDEDDTESLDKLKKARQKEEIEKNISKLESSISEVKK